MPKQALKAMRPNFADLKNRFMVFSKRNQLQFDASGIRAKRTACLSIFFLTILAAIGSTASYFDYFNQHSYVFYSFLVFLCGFAYYVQRMINSAHRGLRKHYKLLKEAFEYAPAGRLITKASGKTIFVNEAFNAIFDIEGEIDVDKIRSKFSSNHLMRKRFDKMMDKLKKGQSVVEEFSFETEDLEKRWLLVQVSPLISHEVSIQWRVEDITERHQFRERIVEEQSKLSDFLNMAPVGFYSVDQDGKFLYVNQTLADWLECDPIKLVNSALRLHDFFVDDYSDFPAYSFMKGNRKTSDSQFMMKGLGGRVFRASVSQTIVKSGDGSIIKTRSIVRDLTPEHEWERALKQSNERFAHFFQSAPIGIALVDKKGVLLECNQAFSMITNSLVEDIVDKPLYRLFAKEEQKQVQEKLDMTFKGKKVSYPLDLSLNKADVNLQLYAKTILVGDDDKPSLIVHIADTTEQKKLELQFVQSQKMQAIGQLAGGVAHDFNNLLTAMLGFCDLLLMRHKPGDPSFGDLMQIKQNANRGANLVKQLLAFSRKQTLNPRILDVTDVLAELSNLLSRLIGETIEMHIFHGQDLGYIKVDQGQLEQVIINLVVNARDAMLGGGVLNIYTKRVVLKKELQLKPDTIPVGEYVCIEVEDDGTGITKDNLARIFDPFFSTKEVGSGTGLGLSTVYGIVRQTDGFIRVETAMNKGTKFTIFLPHFEQPAVRPSRLEDLEKRHIDLTGTQTILLVEDEDPVRMFSSRALRNKGYKVIEAVNGESALAILKEKVDEIDLLISDVVMPNMDGPTLYKEVQGLRPDLKFIFMSGYAEDRFQDKLSNLEEIHFLAKPFSLKQLATKVKEVMSLN